MEHAAGSRDNSMIREFKDVEIQDVDDVSMNFRKGLAMQPEQLGFSFAESLIQKNKDLSMMRADSFHSYKSSFQSVSLDHKPKQYCIYCQRFLNDKDSPGSTDAPTTNEELLHRQGEHPILLINDKQVSSAHFQNLMPSKMSDVFRPLAIEHPDSERKFDSLFRKPFEYSGRDYQQKDQEEDLMATKPRLSLQTRPYDLKVLS